MKQTRCVVALLSMVIGGANLLHAQNPAPKSGPMVSALDLSKLSIATTLTEMQPATIDANGEAPAPIQIVMQWLQLQPAQVQELGQLLQARQAAAVPLLQGIQQRTKQVEALLNSGGNPAAVGILVFQIHALQQQVAHVQQDFLSKFVSLLDPEQQQRLEAVRIAAQLQPILPAFRELNLF
jgi:Spy/CpxP family protein refolding chaperone